MDIKGKVAIVTGSAKRVGRAIALALASHGAHLIIHYRTSAQEAQDTVKQVRRYGVRSYAVKADISSALESRGIVLKTLEYFKRVDILVNSASLYEKSPFYKISEEDWDRHLNTNLKGVFFVSQEAAKIMVKQKSGKIVNIIDSDTNRPYKDYLPYLVSKSGLVGLTYCLAKELVPHVQVNGVSPGPVMMQKGWGEKIRRAIIRATPLKKIGDPKDIANAVLFCVKGTDFMTGAIIPVDGGQHIA